LTNYSRTVPPDELSDAHLDALAEYHGVETRDDALEELGKDPVIEVGREDGRRVGSSAVLRPCPLCGGEHTHKFGEALEEGRLVQHASECPEADLYWLVWFGKGEGNWQEDDRFEDSPRI
jgi:hypothetical protein